MLWSGASVALQIPAGALADRVSRRLLLGVGCALRAVGFGLWVVVPGYPGFAAGFVLWAVKGSLTSGTLESLVYDELAAVGRTDRYTRLTGRASAALGAAELVATVAAGPVLAVGGYRLVGYASVAVCIVQTCVALSFPDAPRSMSDEDEPGYLATLRAGVSEVVRRPQLRSLVLVAGLGGLLAVDEYLPLLARDSGVAASAIPALLLVPALARIVASAVVGTGRWQAVAVPMAVCAVLIGAGGLSGSILGLVGVGVGFGCWQLAQLVVEARVQHAVVGPARATVTSVVEVLGEGTALVVTGAIGLAADWLGLPVLFAVDGLFLLALAAYAALRVRPEPASWNAVKDNETGSPSNSGEPV